MSITANLLQPLNQLVQYTLQFHPNHKEILQTIQGKTLRITITGTPIDLLFQANKNTLCIIPFNHTPYDVSITGAPFTLMQLAMTQQINSSSKVQISGDLATIENFRTLITVLDIDWEEQLSKIMGDTMGVAVHHSLQKSLQWLNNLSQNVKQNLSEFTQEEYQITPTRVECEHFFDLVDTLNLDTERLEKRIQRIEAMSTHGKEI